MVRKLFAGTGLIATLLYVITLRIQHRDTPTTLSQTVVETKLDCNQCMEDVSQMYPVPQRWKQYQRCQKEKIPYITHPLETAQYLLFTNSSIIRFGDGEFRLMRGEDETFQISNQNLTKGLIQAFLDEDPNIIIGIQDCFTGFPLWNRDFTNWWYYHEELSREWVMKHANLDRQYFAGSITSTYIHTDGTYCALLPLIYDTLRRIWAGRDIVLLKGDNKQVYTFDVYDTAKTQTIYLAPRYHAFAAYERLKQLLFAEPADKLFILTAGPLSRILAYDLAKAGRRALDMGHLAKDYDYYKSGKHDQNNVFFERNEHPPPFSPDL